MWIITTCQCISPEISVKGFKKFLSNAIDEIDYVLWNDGSEEDGNARSESEEDEGTDCEGGDSDSDW